MKDAMKDAMKEKKLILLIVGNVMAIIGIIIVLNMSMISNKTTSIVNSLLAEENIITSEEAILQKDNLDLIEQQENEKILESLVIKENEILEKELALEEREKKLANDLLVFEEEKKSFLAQREHLKKKQEEAESYDQLLVSLARKFTSMQPEKAVERLVAIGDDVFILDILKKIDELAEASEQNSIVPFFISLMPKDDASRILRNSLIKF